MVDGGPAFPSPELSGPQDERDEKVAREAYAVVRGAYRGAEGVPPHWDDITATQREMVVAIVRVAISAALATARRETKEEIVAWLRKQGEMSHLAMTFHVIADAIERDEHQASPTPLTSP